MSAAKTLFLYAELGVLNVCIAPEEPFYTIPMVSASKRGEDLVFGKDALEKDESWQLTWLQGGAAPKTLLEQLYSFVFLQPAVQNAEAKCKIVVVAFPYTLVSLPDKNEDCLESHPEIFISDGIPLRVYAVTEDVLSTSQCRYDGARICLNVSGDFTNLRRFQRWGTIFSHAEYIRVGLDTMVNLFIKLLCEKGYNFTTPKDRLFCHKLVMDYCYVALDFDKELERIEKLDGPLHEITLEDGSILELGKECIMATEVLFKPGLVGMDEESIMSLFKKQGYLLSPLVFAGGCASDLKGLGERLQLELQAMTKNLFDDPFTIVKTNLRQDATHWID